MARIKLRTTKASDFDGIFVLLQQLWTYKKLNKARVKKAFLASIKEKTHKSFIAMDGSIVDGYAGTTIHNNLWQAGTLCRLNELVVDETIRGKGIGSMLLKCVEAYARKKKCRGIDLESAKHRKRTHKFYRDRGYESRAYFFMKLFYGDK